MATVQRATLFDPKTGNRTAVDVGSQQARQLFGEGYQLETPTNNFSTPMASSTPAPAAPQISSQPPLPVVPGENQALINKYVSAGYSTDEAKRRVDELFANRPASPAGTPTPRTLTFAPTGETLSTAAPAPQAPKVSFNDAIAQLLVQAQGGTGNQDLLEQRNKLINQRFGAINAETPTNLQVLSPAQQAALRSQTAGGMEDQLAGIDAALQARNIKKSDALKLLTTAKDLFATEKKDTSIQTIGGRKVLIDNQTGEQIKDLGADVAGNDPLVSAVIANPSLFAQLSPTEKAKISPALNALGFTAFGKPLSDTAIANITQTESALQQLTVLRKTIQDNLQYIGPISGLTALNPYSKARQVQADIDRVKQSIGKALEGGVLRKEDEDKYKKILATINDTPETALYKLDQLAVQLQNNLDIYKNNQALGGRNIDTGTGNTSDTNDADFNALRNDPGLKDYSDDQIRGILGKNSVGGDTKPASKVLSVQLPSGEVHQGGSASWRNNNPGNIKFNAFAKQYGAVQGSAATDGGYFAAFPTEETGLKAQRDLLKNPNYTKLSLNDALLRWSGGGYGAEVAPLDLRKKSLAQMNNSDIDRLIEAMRRREGWKPGTIIA